jgi:hypothetical protein
MEPEGLLHVHKTPPLDTVLKRMSSLYTLTPYFFEFHCNIILSKLSGLVPSAFPPKIL